MNIKEIYMSFTGKINVGERALFIIFDKHGSYVDQKELLLQSQHFNKIVIDGDEPMLQINDIGKFVKALIKKSPDIKIEIHTKGTIKPKLITGIQNVKFVVSLQLKNSMKPFDIRINSSVIEWFNLAGYPFIFNVYNNDDISEVNMLVNQYGISLQQVYLSVGGPMDYKQYQLILNSCIKHKYNICIDLKETFWPTIGKKDTREVY